MTPRHLRKQILIQRLVRHIRLETVALAEIREQNARREERKRLERMERDREETNLRFPRPEWSLEEDEATFPVEW